MMTLTRSHQLQRSERDLLILSPHLITILSIPEPTEMDSDEEMPTISTAQQWSFDPTVVRPSVNWAQGNECHRIHSRNLVDSVKGVRWKTLKKRQAYVALRRATCQEGLRVSRFDPKKIMAHEEVRTFYDSLYSVKKATNLGDSHGIFGKGHKRHRTYSSYSIDPVEEQAMYDYGSR